MKSLFYIWMQSPIPSPQSPYPLLEFFFFLEQSFTYVRMLLSCCQAVMPTKATQGSIPLILLSEP